ncbi:hypothetical protein EC973_002568 [Apophysomyces ossiformis]|uniref:RRM domain-containing protein n=1 Tax=Apophysomyces ossiformis TaxID=679940 RepID=A0A8H7BNL9_9FUNG|nr:hypothetical protein EC973_002568 [Apophysomyces ossiformis]
MPPGASHGFYMMTTGTSATPSSATSQTLSQAATYVQQLPGNASGNQTITTNGANPNMAEEISTIFVVGFPDDMQEREFQNMFIFSPGFEAATLKVPSKDQEEDPGISNGNSSRKQTIGFAKFRTRFEALEARDILNGRKVDAEKGSMLKAEMAKKNLHTKRGLSSEQQQQQQQQQQSLPPVQQQQQQQTQQSSSQQVPSQIPVIPTPTNSYPIYPSKRFPFPSTTNHAAYEAFHSVPAIPNDTTTANNDFSYPDFYPDLFSPTATFAESAFSSRAQSFERAASVGDIFNMSGSIMPSTSSRLPGFAHRLSAKNILELDNNAPINYLSKSTPLHIDRGLHPASKPGSMASNPTTFPPPNAGLSSVLEEAAEHGKDDVGEFSLTQRLGDMTINTSISANNAGLLSPEVTSPTFRNFGAVGSTNPADHNPPCNTLYVGNLPPNASEDELKTLFSKSTGYKRLSFRNKSNGPMCFVEFEDVAFATQALQKLNGNPLSNSVKGGIRLSFSKNPLGVRQNNNGSTSTHSTPTGAAFGLPGNLSFLPRRESVSSFDPQLS